MRFLAAALLLASLHSEANVCAEDTKKLCPGIEPGKGQIAKCLGDFKDQLSPACAKELKNFLSKNTARNPCFEDLAEFCAGVPSDPERLSYCLLKNEKRLGPTCAADFKQKKGNLVVKDVCAQDVADTCYAAVTGPEGAVTKCLIQNRAKLSKFCQNALDRKVTEMKKQNPCFDDTEKNCPTQVTFMDIQECLEKRIPKLAPECKKLVEAEKEKAGANPCYRDLRRHCRPNIAPDEQHRCLTVNDAHLSNGCRQFRVKEEEKVKKMVELCEADRLKVCPKAPFQNGLVLKCLKENKDKVSKACGDLL